jgi:hypothetical protein
MHDLCISVLRVDAFQPCLLVCVLWPHSRTSRLNTWGMDNKSFCLGWICPSFTRCAIMSNRGGDRKIFEPSMLSFVVQPILGQAGGIPFSSFTFTRSFTQGNQKRCAQPSTTWILVMSASSKQMVQDSPLLASIIACTRFGNIDVYCISC